MVNRDELLTAVGKTIEELSALDYDLEGWYPVLNDQLDTEIINFVTAEWDALLIKTKEYDAGDLSFDEDLQAGYLS